MPDPTEVSSDVIAGSAALAGLILVYLGALSAGYASFDAQQKPSVRGRYQLRAWIAFVGFVLAILATGLALISKWLRVECMAISAIVLMVIALIWSGWVALATVREIR